MCSFATPFTVVAGVNDRDITLLFATRAQRLNERSSPGVACAASDSTKAVPGHVTSPVVCYETTGEQST
jgi:hypothetical protein